MKGPNSASSLPPSLQRRFWIFGVVLAIVVVSFVVFGIVVWTKIDRLQSSQKILESGSEATVDPEDTESDDEDMSLLNLEELATLPVRRDGEYAHDEGKREIRKGQRSRSCGRCCRDCDCSTNSGVLRDPVKQEKCIECCKECGEDKMCVAKTLRELIPEVFRPLIGHFIGVHASKVKGNRACSDPQKDAGTGSLALTIDVGLTCYWKYSKWMGKAAKRLYKLNRNGTVLVRDGGLYFIYGHMAVNETKQVAREALVMKRGGKVTELATCANTAGYPLDPSGEVMDPAGSFRTCSLARFAELEAGSELFLGVWRNVVGKKALKTTFHGESLAYFGIIKY
ncbi:uncharacterized protein LOC135494883 isoform X2 [Lineus longissimus]|uniref:uncharacterized protein LOC135494883 isoform X2 n=1 Tax=Lineus longissimus TaxID=88925 RepID=UPI00315D1E80